MINTHYLELPLSRLSFGGSEGVQATEILLYQLLAGHLLPKKQEIVSYGRCKDGTHGAVPLHLT